MLFVVLVSMGSIHIIIGSTGNCAKILLKIIKIVKTLKKKLKNVIIIKAEFVHFNLLLKFLKVQFSGIIAMLKNNRIVSLLG